MSFLYINPGTADLLDVAGTTVENPKYNPFGGISFWQDTVDRKSCTTLPEIPSELYMKFCLYLKGASAYATVYAGNNTGCSVSCSSGTWRFTVTSSNSQVCNRTAPEAGLKVSGMNDILFHARYGYYSAGYISVIVNGTEVYTANTTVDFNQKSTGNVPSDGIVFYSRNEDALLSNIIVSDAPVAWNEKVAVLAAKSTDTDMADNGDGSYTASAAGQYLFQSLDADALIGTYGEASPVTGVFLAGNPAYCTGAELTKAIACGRKDGIVTEYGTAALGTDRNAHALIGSRLSLTLADLRGREFGWKAGV